MSYGAYRQDELQGVAMLRPYTGVIVNFIAEKAEDSVV